MDFHPSQMVTGTARPWCVWKLSSWVVASFVIPTWRFRRWGWNVMDGFDPLKTKSFWFPKKCGFGHFEGLKGKMVWSFWGLVHIQPCCFGRWLFFHLFAGFLCCHFEVPVVTFQGCMARWFLFCFFCRSLHEWSVNVCMRMKSCHTMDWPTWAEMCWCLWQAYKTHTSAEMHLQKAPETPKQQWVMIFWCQAWCWKAAIMRI